MQSPGNAFAAARFHALVRCYEYPGSGSFEADNTANVLFFLIMVAPGNIFRTKPFIAIPIVSIRFGQPWRRPSVSRQMVFSKNASCATIHGIVLLKRLWQDTNWHYKNMTNPDVTKHKRNRGEIADIVRSGVIGLDSLTAIIPAVDATAYYD